MQTNAKLSNSDEVSSDNKIEFRHSNDERKLFVKGGKNTRIHYKPSEAPHYDEEDALILSPTNASRIAAKRSVIFRIVQTFGVLASIAWFGLCVAYFAMQGGIVTQTPYEMGIFMAGMIAPVAFFWMLLSYMQRNSDVRYYAENLRNELHTLFFPSDEDSVRVNRDIERMTLQAADLASSSKAALKAIHRTRMGLRHEIKEFASLARQAENHIISLSDGMVDKTSKLNSIVSDVETRIETINNKSEKSIEVWDNSSARMVERASDIESVMDKGANRILSMADVAEEKSRAVSEMFDGTITSLGLTVDAVIDRLGGINDEFSTHTHTLERSATDLSKESGRLGAVIDDQIEQINDATARSVETITQSLISISDHKDNLENSVESLSAKANDVASVITASVNRLDESADTISTKAESIEARISDKSTMIANSLNGFDEQIDRMESISDTAKHRLGEGIETAVNGSMQIGDAIRRGMDTLIQTSNDVTQKSKEQIELTIGQIQNLKDADNDNINNTEKLLDLLSQSRIQIEKSTSTAKAHVEMMNESVSNNGEKLQLSAITLTEQVKSVTRALEEPLRLVGIAIADADGRHEQIQSTLERRVQDLKDASDKASNSVDTIRQSLREQTQDISSLSGRVTAQSKSLNEELATNKQQMGTMVEDAVNNFENLLSVMSDTSISIQDISNKAAENIEGFNNGISISMDKLSDASTHSGLIFDTSIQSIDKQTNDVELRLEQIISKIKTSTTTLQDTSTTITPIYDRIDNGAEKAIQSLLEVKESYLDVANSTMDKMEKAASVFDTRLVKLQSGSEDASTLLKSSGDYLRDCLDDIEVAAKSANDKMRTIGTSMEGQSSNIHILTDQTILRIESIQSLINEQFVELTESVGQAVTQIEQAGEVFDGKADSVASKAEHVLTQFAAAGDEAQAKAYELKQASLNVASTSEQVVSDISSQITLLSNNSDDALTNLRKTSESLSIKSKEIDLMMKSVLDHAKIYGDEMRQQVRDIAKQSDESANQVSQSMQHLIGRMSEMNDKTKSVVTFINDTNQSLYEQSGRFITAVSKSAQAAEQVTDLFSRQSDNLLKSAKTAVEKAEQIKSTELKVGRDSFLSSARFVMESLHSLSIDFIRTIDGEIADKDWKAYQKGDIAIFTSQLVSRLGDMPADKIRNKYAEDTEFRNYVQKFMHQFEDILKQTDTVDRGAILGTTFAASDVGKIYRFLIHVTGRENKIAQQAA